MAEDINTFQAIVTGGTAIAVAFFGFIGKRFINKVDQTAAALAQHEKDDIGKYATIDQITRVHTRIDEGNKTNETNFREVRDGIGEIKTLIIQGKHK